jgi:poly(3-hydroxybutyrate) depolymerase
MDWWTRSVLCELAQTKVRGDLTFDTYACCEGRTVVRMVMVEGMRHRWPEKRGKRTKPGKSGEIEDLSGTKLLLDFFGDKAKP